MTQLQFDEFNKLHKPTSIEESSEFGMVINFDNGEYVRLSVGYDGIMYRHQSEDMPTDSTKLMKDLQDRSPNFIENMMKKYGE